MGIKRFLSAGLLMAGIMALFFGCDKEITEEGTPVVDGSNGKLLSLTASAQDFINMETGTRASESGTTLSFQSGDAIGVFGVKNGSLICNNLRFTTTNGSTWSGPETYHESGTTYFAYYPYEAGMNGKTSLAAIQSEFESRLNGNPDQSSQANYMTYSKLLVSTSGSVSPSGDRLSFRFKHALAMVEVVLPDKLEGTMSANGKNFPLYTPSSLSITASFSLSSTSVSFYNISGKTYRRVVKPGTGLNFKATLCNAFNYTDNSTVNAGSYKKFTLGNVSETIQIGDFAYGKDNGTLAFYPGSTTTDAPDKDNCIGVVATVGNQYNRSDSYTHGTVVAKNDCPPNLWVFDDGVNRPAIVSSYSPKAPSGTTGWYLPGKAELYYLCTGTYNSSLDAHPTASSGGVAMKNTLNSFLGKSGGNAWADSDPDYYIAGSSATYGYSDFIVLFGVGNLILNTYANHARLCFAF